MKEKTKELVNKVGTDTSGKWIYYDRLDDLIQLVVDECIISVNEAKMTFGGTTYDYYLANATKAVCIKSIQDKFNEVVQ